MNYEVHVGDYVETAGGAIGYVSDACHMWWQCVLPADGYDSNNDYSIFGLDDDTVYKHFSRIGAYDFTKPEQKKIKSMPDATSTIDYGSNSWIVDKIVEARNKINELVDAVNKLMDKEDKE